LTDISELADPLVVAELAAPQLIGEAAETLA
jgi:hypothetical protein